MKSIKNQKTQQTTWVGIDVVKKSYDAAIYLPLGNDDKPRAVTELFIGVIHVNFWIIFLLLNIYQCYKTFDRTLELTRNII